MKRAFALPFILMLAAGATPRAESVTMTIDRPTALHFLRAATPYSFEVTKMGFTEIFTLYHPRDLRFDGGKIRLTVDCRGEPIGFHAELEPTLSVYFDRQKNAFVVKVESLPIKLGALGTIRLDEYLDPVEIPMSFSSPVNIGIPGLSIDTIIRELNVLEDRIEAKADLVFRKEPPPAATAAQP